MELIQFRSSISSKKARALSDLLFFNANQKKFASGIVSAVETFGAPEVKKTGDILQIFLNSEVQVQTLFAFDPARNDRLIGAALFYRNAPETITLLHIAVDEQYAINIDKKYFVAPRLIEELRNIASKIKGVREIAIYYSGEKKRTISARKMK